MLSPLVTLGTPPHCDFACSYCPPSHGIFRLSHTVFGAAALKGLINSTATRVICAAPSVVVGNVKIDILELVEGPCMFLWPIKDWSWSTKSLVFGARKKRCHQKDTEWTYFVQVRKIPY